MNPVPANVGRMADALRAAAAAHHEFEVEQRRLRHDDKWVDSDWATWYAAFLIGAGWEHR